MIDKQPKIRCSARLIANRQSVLLTVEGDLNWFGHDDRPGKLEQSSLSLQVDAAGMYRVFFWHIAGDQPKGYDLNHDPPLVVHARGVRKIQFQTVRPPEQVIWTVRVTDMDQQFPQDARPSSVGAGMPLRADTQPATSPVRGVSARSQSTPASGVGTASATLPASSEGGSTRAELQNIAMMVRDSKETTNLIWHHLSGGGGREQFPPGSAAPLQRELDVARRRNVALESDLEASRSETRRLQKERALLISGKESRSSLAAALGSLLSTLRGAESAEPVDDPLTEEEARALGDHLQRLEQTPGSGGVPDALRHLSNTLLEAAADPLRHANEALEGGHLEEAVRAITAHVANPATGTEGRGKRYYRERLQLLAIELWRSHRDEQHLKLYLPKTLAVLGLELIEPEVGRSFSPKNQIATERREADEGQPRNSILEVLEPGFKLLDSGKVIAKPKVAIASR